MILRSQIDKTTLLAVRYIIRSYRKYFNSGWHYKIKDRNLIEMHLKSNAREIQGFLADKSNIDLVIDLLLR